MFMNDTCMDENLMCMNPTFICMGKTLMDENYVYG
jgi:hypothetical protein